LGGTLETPASLLVPVYPEDRTLFHLLVGRNRRDQGGVIVAGGAHRGLLKARQGGCRVPLIILELVELITRRLEWKIEEFITHGPLFSAVGMSKFTEELHCQQKM
jgi:hypothetical protein